MGMRPPCWLTAGLEYQEAAFILSWQTIFCEQKREGKESVLNLDNLMK
jgi:ribonuclease I